MMVHVLDLGTTKVACMAAGLDDLGNIEAKGVAEVPCKGLKRGVVCDLDETSQAIDSCVRRLRAITGIEPDRFVVGVNGAHLEGVSAQGFVPIYPKTRQITREDVLHVINHSRQMLPSPDREQIQALPREFRIDGQKGIRKPIGLIGGRLEVVTHLITGQTTHVQNIEKAVSMAGYKIDQMVCQPVAVGLGIVSEQDMELGCVAVDIGGGTTSVSIMAGGSIAYSAVLPVGSDLVTSDLNKLLKTSPEEAERLKLEYGSALSGAISDVGTVEVHQIGQTSPRHMQRRVLCEIIESRMREIALMVKQQIEKSGLNGVLPGGILITGGGSNLPHVAELFQSVIKHMGARTVVPKLAGDFERQAAAPGMAVVAGLAVFALDEQEDEIAPASGIGSWKERIKTLKTLFSART